MLLGILIIILIGQKFFLLAGEYGKSKISFAILGVATYYAGTIVGGFVYAILYYTMYPEASDESVDNLFSRLIWVGIGLLSCLLLHNILQRRWKREKKLAERDTISEIGRDDHSKD